MLTEPSEANEFTKRQEQKWLKYMHVDVQNELGVCYSHMPKTTIFSDSLATTSGHIHVLSNMFALGSFISVCAFVQSDMCAQQRLGLTCASTQSDQSFRCLQDGISHYWLSNIRQVNILIRMHKSASWSKSMLGAHVGTHYKNKLIHIYWKFYRQKMKIFR